MRDKLSEQNLQALKTAFCYMPKPIDVNTFDYGDRVDRIISDIQIVRETLLAQGVDPDEVYGEMNPDNAGPSCV
jgi:hypothetical protein